MNRLRNSGIFLMLIGTLSFTFMAVCVKHLMGKVPFWEIIFFRSAVSAVMIGLLLKRRREPLRQKDETRLILRSLLGFLGMVLNFYVLGKLSLGDAAVLFNMGPIFVILLAAIYLKEKMTLFNWSMVLLSFSGVIFVVRPSFDMANLPSLAALGGAFSAASAFLLVRTLSKKFSAYTIAFYFMVISSLLSLPLMLQNFKVGAGLTLAILILTGIFGGFGQIFITFAFQKEKVSIVSPISYTGVLFSFILGVLFFGEIPTIYSLLGAVLIIGPAVAIAYVNHYHPSWVIGIRNQ